MQATTTMAISVYLFYIVLLHARILCLVMAYSCVVCLRLLSGALSSLNMLLSCLYKVLFLCCSSEFRIHCDQSRLLRVACSLHSLFPVGWAPLQSTHFAAVPGAHFRRSCSPAQ